MSRAWLVVVCFLLLAGVTLRLRGLTIYQRSLSSEANSASDHPLRSLHSRSWRSIRVDAEHGVVRRVTLADDSEVPWVLEDATAIELRVFAWDDSAAVYLSVGADGQPGVAGVDDDGSGVIDDLSELGATGSDDEILTPDHARYAAVVDGAIGGSVVSRGAMRRVTESRQWTGPSEVRIDRIDTRDPTAQKTSVWLDLVL